MFKKLCNWITADFDKGYEQEPLLPNTLKEWLVLFSVGALGLLFLFLIIYFFRALEIFVYGV